MPIDEHEWESGRTADTKEEIVLRFLSRHKKKAFTANEIYDNIYNEEQLRETETVTEEIGKELFKIVEKSELRQTLENLASSGKIEKKSIEQSSGSEEYYRISQT